jgi:hypothetical protein
MNGDERGPLEERGTIMSGPFIYVGTWTIKPGQQEVARKSLAEHADFIETNEPRLIAFHIYFDDAGTKAGVVQVHPDAESMDYHMQLIAEHLAGAGEFIGEILTEQCYGAPTDSFAKELEGYASSGIPVTVLPVHGGGFTRASVR